MKKGLIGCGIALLVVIVILVAGSAVMVSWVKKTVPDEELKAVREEMLDRYGKREEYVPPLDGMLQPERIETLIRVREDLLLSRAEIAAGLDEVLQRVRATEESERSFFGKIIEGIQLARSGVGLVGSGMQYLAVRTDTLLKAGMSDGEYVYLYALMTYSWLKWDPMYSIGDELFERAKLDDGDIDKIKLEYRSLMVRHLRNQRRALEELPERSVQEEETLQRVVETLEKRSSGSFPFVDDMPPEWLATLEPYRERYVATLPRTPAEFLLDAASLLSDEETQGVQINF